MLAEQRGDEPPGVAGLWPAVQQEQRFAGSERRAIEDGTRDANAPHGCRNEITMRHTRSIPVSPPDLGATDSGEWKTSIEQLRGIGLTGRNDVLNSS
ncbi:hypothetical protein SANTM175S_00825 [Streptomyces antimycoticus]